MTMGEKILNMRKARGWSQEEFAEQVGVTRQAVGRWESDSAKPDADNIVTICDLFGVSADYLLRDIGGNATLPKQENGSQKSIRSMSQRRWIGCILFVTCAAVLLVIWMMSIMYPQSVWPEQMLRDFLHWYKLKLVWYIAWIGLAMGLWKALSPKPLREYPIGEWMHGALEKLRKLYALILSKCKKK